MAKLECDTFVHWELNHRGRIIGFQGKNDYHPFGTVARMLMPRLPADFADPGDLLFVGRGAFLSSGDVGALANGSRDTLLRASLVRAVLAVGMPAAAITWLLTRFGVGTPLVTVPAFLALVGLGRLIDAGASAKRGAAAYRTHLDRQQAERLALLRRYGAPPPPPPPREDREARIADAYAGRLEGARWHPVGAIAIPDGRLVAGDAFDLSEATGQEIAVPPGTYSVSVALVPLRPEQRLFGEERLAYASLRLSEEEAVRWEPVVDALGEAVEIGIDSATAAFASREGRRALASRFESQDHVSAEFEVALNPVYETGWTLLEADGAQLAAFQTGFGDGFYPVYRALDAQGRPVAIVIDFKVY